MLAIGAAAMIPPITIQAQPCGAPVCDPHGYVTIFTFVPAVGVALLALVGVLVLSSGYRAGFGIGLGAAVGCAGVLGLTGPDLPGRVLWPVAGVTVMVAGLALAGLRWAPVRVRPRLEEPPYPSLG